MFGAKNLTRKTLDRRSVTFRVQGLFFFLFSVLGCSKSHFWPQLLHDFLYSDQRNQFIWTVLEAFFFSKIFFWFFLIFSFFWFYDFGWFYFFLLNFSFFLWYFCFLSKLLICCFFFKCFSFWFFVFVEFFSFVFWFFKLHSGRSKVTRGTVGRDIDQPAN